MQIQTLKPYLSIILTLAMSIVGLQAQFTFDHIGTGATGSLTPNAEPGSFTLVGGGDDIWSASDNCDFAHGPVTGDFDVRVRVESLEPVARWTKAGLMARETLLPNSRMAFNRVTPPDVPTGSGGNGANDSRYAYRTGTTSGPQGEHEDGTGAPQYPNGWLRLVRAGNVITAHASADGQTWRVQGVQDTSAWEGGALPANLELGLAVSRHSGADTLATCEFRDYGHAATAIAAITTQPANQTVEENFTATFRFTAPAGLDIYDIQWRKNGADIGGATGASYTTPPLAATESGSAYSVAIRHRGNGSTATSDNAVVVVVPDVTAPAVAAVNVTPGRASRFSVVFSEPVNEADAENVANYSLPGITINSAELQADNRTVVISSSSLNSDGCRNLVVSNVRDRASVPNTVAANSTPVVYTDGSIRYREYRDIGGNAVADLTGNAKYPNSPDFTSYVGIAENPNGGGGQGDNYGGTLTGFLHPPVSGLYRFYIAADDNAAFYLSTDASPANRVLLATEPEWTDFRAYTGVDRRPGCGGVGGSEACENVSVEVNLQCGQRYYIEGLWKEGGGGDHFSVGWQPPGAGIPTQGIPGQYLSPADRGPLALTATLPADTTISENQDLVLNLGGLGAPPYFIQWYYNGTAIPGATSAEFRIVNAKMSDAGNYHASVENSFGTANSRTAVVNVIIDTIAPSIVSAQAPAGNGTQFDLIFTEPVNEADAETLSKYSLPGVTLNSATLQADNKTVRFTTSSLHTDGCKVLTVGTIRDRAIPANTFAGGTVGVVAAVGGLRYHQFNGIGGVAVANLTSNAKFPNAPDVISRVTQFENPAGSAGQGDNYGSQFLGFVHPPVTGNYRFLLSADDGAALWLSTDENPANKVLIATEPIWSAFRAYNGAGAGGGGRETCAAQRPACNISLPIPLQGGCKYFIEGIYKEGGGGDFMSVTWQLPGQAAPPANGTPPIQAAFISPYDVPASVPANQPADITALEGRIVTFTADIRASPPLAVQWYRDGVAIPGANGNSLAVGPLRYPEDNGATFFVTVSNALAQVTSRTATLTVTEDTEPPQVVSASGSTTLDRAILSYNEIIDPGTGGDAFNYSISDGVSSLNVASVAVNADGQSVTLMLDPGTPLQLGRQYTITANNILDISGNEMVTGSASFNSVVEGCGGIIFEAYNTSSTPGTAVTLLTSHPNFPNNPDFRTTIAGLDSRLAYPTDAREQYGARMRGVYVPPYSGRWTLFLRSDDASELWFNPNGIDAAGKVRVQAEGGCCQAFEALPTAPMNLIGGRPYYIEVLYKEGGGGDYGQVAARLTSDTTTPLAPIGARDVGQFAEPGFSGNLTITTQPADQTVQENRVATFSVAAESSLGLPICHQWFRDGSPIAGATGPTYSLRAGLVDNGAVFTVRVSIIGNVVLSAAATLTVTVDSGGPRVVSASGVDSLRNVLVRFDEQVSSTSAADPFNYTIPGLTVDGAVLLGDGTTVRLATSEQTPGTVYTVTVSGVTDIAATPNVVDPDHDTANFTAFVLSCGFLSFAAYDTASTPGNAVSLLTSHPNFPDNPRDRAYISSFNSRDAYPDDSHEQYGGKIHGVFIPPVSGDWIFYLRSDDASELWLNASGNNPAGAAKIAEELGCCRQFADIPSAPQPLVAGQPYYIEGLYKEGGGGDYIQVAAKLSTDPTAPNALRPIGGTSLGVYADPTGASVNIVQQPVSEQTVCLNPTVPQQPSATFSVSADVTPSGAPVSIQWQRWNGTYWADVGAVGNVYSFTPTLADNGAKFRAAVYTLGASANSSESALTVIQMNTPPAYDLAASASSSEDGAPQTVPGFASNITSHSIPRVPVVFSSSFDNATGLTLYGIATVAEGVLKLTTPVNSINGAAAIDSPTRTYESFELNWKSRIGGGGGGGADGYSVNIGDSIPGDPSATGPAEEGRPGSALTVTVDTFNNADLRNPDEGIQIKWMGAEVAYQMIPKDNTLGDGNYLRKDAFVNASLTVDAAGVATFTYDGNTITASLPGYTGLTANRLLFWARTGNANDNHWIDDLALEAFPYDNSSSEAAQNVTFEVSNSNPALFSAQPAISPDGTLTYTAAPNACGQATVTVVARDDGGTACNGDNTSDPKTFTINIACVNDCPVATAQSIVAFAGTPKAITLTGTDIDGDPLSASVASNPSHGSLSVVSGQLQYTANAGYEGPDSFTFTVSDGTCTSGPATVSITVTANREPVCVARIVPEECSVTFESGGERFSVALNNENVCLVLDGSGSSDPDGDPLTISWVIDGTNIISGTTVTNCFDVGCHTITMIASDGSAQCHQFLDVCVVTPAEGVEEIIGLVDSTPVERKNKRPLLTSLKAAAAAFDRDGLERGTQMLQVFRHKVRAQIEPNNPAEAAMFDKAAADLIAVLECVVNAPPRNDE